MLENGRHESMRTEEFCRHDTKSGGFGENIQIRAPEQSQLTNIVYLLAVPVFTRSRHGTRADTDGPSLAEAGRRHLRPGCSD